MPLAFLCALALSTDAWTLKPNLTPGTKTTWNVSVDAETDQGNHQATFDLIEEAKATTEKGQPVHVSIANLMMDSNPGPTMESDGIVNAQNVLTSTGEDDAQRRMFAPLLFDYPVVPVSKGDVWTSVVTSTAKDAPKITYDYKAGDIDTAAGTLQIEAKVKEAGDDGLSATETWWVDKTGKVMKFKIKITNWRPVATGGAPIGATITGKLKE